MSRNFSLYARIFFHEKFNINLSANLNAGQSPVHALRSIKLQMLRGEKGEEYTHPSYWAPFVLFGDERQATIPLGKLYFFVDRFAPCVDAFLDL